MSGGNSSNHTSHLLMNAAGVYHSEINGHSGGQHTQESLSAHYGGQHTQQIVVGHSDSSRPPLIEQPVSDLSA